MTMTTKPRLSKHGNFMPIDAGQDADPTKSPPFHIGGSAAEVGEPDNPHSGVPVDLMINDAIDAAIAVTIERCAQVADDHDDEQLSAEERRIIKAIAAAIRALKDK